MLDSYKIGTYLSELRKRKDLTQVELAEKLNISHQAVSKWEIGSTIPDIEMLMKLAELYNVKVDDILNAGENITVSSSDQVKPLFVQQNQSGKKYSLCELISLAPFIEKETLNQMTENVTGDYDICMLTGIAPFIDGVHLEKLVEDMQLNDCGLDELSGLCPFLNRRSTEKIIETMFQNGVRADCMGVLSGIAPFVGTATIDMLLLNFDGEYDLDELNGIAPFASRTVFLKLVERLK